MAKVTEGQLVSKGLRFAIVVARFNSFITERLLAGALDALGRTGCAEGDIEIVKVPGSWEMPVVARALAAHKKY
jgi:6,7-dimethyl-8-ribityllumazine synthase